MAPRALLAARPSTQHACLLVWLQEVIVLETAAARESFEEVLQTHSIPSIVSRDLIDLVPAWQQQQLAQQHVLSM